MDANIVINAIIRHTVVLIAHLALGGREPLGHIASQVLQQLADALEEQGLAKAVIADMFGMTLRNYRRKFSAADGVRGPDQYLLRHEILMFVDKAGHASRDDIMDRFARGEPRKAQSCLRDLVKMKLLFKTGSGTDTLYMPTPIEVRRSGEDPVGVIANVLHVVVFWLTPGARPTTRAVLAEELGLDDEVLDEALERLVHEKTIMVEEVDGERVYTCDLCVLGLEEDTPQGWEAAVLDHYQAMVTALVIKLRQRVEPPEGPVDPVGGSTYTFGIWEGHPLEEEVLGFFDSVRGQATDLRSRVDEATGELKAEGSLPEEGQKRLIFYSGQLVKRIEAPTDPQEDDG